jgi:hypothetical protein
MAIEEKPITAESKEAYENVRQQAENKVVGDLLSTLSLPEDKPAEVKAPVDTPDEEQEEQQDEEQQEQKETEQEEQTDDDGEVIPKSKHEKIIKSMERRIDSLATKIKQQESREIASTSTDSERARLEKMSDSELQAVKRQVRVAQARETDDAKLAQLVDLELKIDDVQAKAPVRFQSRQQQLYLAKAEEISSDPDLDHTKAAPEILKLAKDIYARYPKFQSLEEGQALALELAANHYKEINKFSTGKDKVAELKRQNNTLKRKTTLDATSSKGVASKVNQARLQAKAYGSQSTYDKEEFVRDDPRFNVDALIPDVFKQK